jgi:hypothetical protein
MLSVVKPCFSWFNWPMSTIVALVLVGIVVCTGLPTPSVLAGVTPLLVIAACLLPCLFPLAWWRRNRHSHPDRIATNLQA